MKIILVMGRYLPAKSGGIENYNHFLANLLLEDHHDVDVAILDNENMEPYKHENINVIPLKQGYESFIWLISNGSYDICHFQELSAFGGIELFWFKEAKKYCNKVYFTFHLPYLTCYKNDFRYFGIEHCNNFTSTERCVDCIIATKLHYRKQDSFNWYNSAIKLSLPILKKMTQIQKLRKNINDRKEELRQLIELCDFVFIYGNWFIRLLHKNGYNSPKLKLIPHISKSEIERKMCVNLIKKKLLFVGRIEKAKGLHLLAEAMNMINTTGLSLDVAGNIVNEKYFTECKRIYTFNYKGVLPRPELLKSFPEYDFLVLPSVFTEMYSLVLREAFYENLPVIVSAAKGNRDVVKEGKSGFIFEYNNADDLAKKIDMAYQKLISGWQPSFPEEQKEEETIQEILSYYA